MSDAVNLALLRGAFEQLRQYCAAHPTNLEGHHYCSTCPLANTCCMYLEYDGMDDFAEDMIKAINYHLGFAAKEVSE